MSISPLQIDHIPLVKDLPTADWKFNYQQFLSLHFGQSYFYPVVYHVAGEIAGTGNAIINGSIGWLANIIVAEPYRNRGIGTTITQHLMAYLEAKRCATQLLIATELGEPVYTKLGFKKTSTYRFFRIEEPLKAPADKYLVKVKKSDLAQILKIDREILADDRTYLISRCYQDGWIYKKNNKCIGYYLPHMGRGPVVATEKEVGLLLLHLKHSESARRSAVPQENSHAIEYLITAGFEYFDDCARMILGRKVPWKPTRIFSYSHGYCG
jgi:GNAT superfamily N-acetyltransferase